MAKKKPIKYVVLLQKKFKCTKFWCEAHFSHLYHNKFILF